MPSRHTPSHRMVEPISQAWGPCEVWSNERGSLMVIDGAQEDRLLALLSSKAVHFAIT